MTSLKTPTAIKNYRPDIDGLRAIAILAVVLFHAFPKIIPGGYIGVDIFFVISGFLISSIIFRGMLNGNFSLGSFYSHRVKRIFPALVVMLAAVFGFAWFFLLPDEFSRLGKHMLTGVGFVQNFTLWQEAGYFDSSSESKPLMHLWSLAVEEQFYLLFPLVVMAAWRLRINLFLLLLAAFLASFLLNIYGVSHDVTATFFLPQTRVWELLAGGLLAYAEMSYRQKTAVPGASQGALHAIPRWLGESATSPLARNAISSFGLLLLIAGMFGIKKDSLFPGWWALVPVAGAVMLLHAGPTAWVNRRLLASRFMVFIGLISYPLYLWHWPLLSLANIVRADRPPVALSILLVIASVVLAWLTYRLIEIPVRFGLPRLHKEFALTSAMLMLAGAGGWVYANNGITSRFPNADRLLTQPADFKWNENVRNGICYLPGRAELQHPDLCREHGHPLVALWGDSHAASLYPGLHRLQQEKGFALTQLTSAACPPFNGVAQFNKEARANCEKVNEIVLSNLQKDKPDILLLHSVYQNEKQFAWATQRALTQVAYTLDRLHARLPETKIVMIGPMPQWHGSPKKTSYINWRKSLFNGNEITEAGQVPIRQNATQLHELDAGLAALSRAKGAYYFSALDTLCNKAGCISRVGNRPEDFIAVDSAHLSKAGAEYFIQRIGPELLALLKKN